MCMCQTTEHKTTCGKNRSARLPMKKRKNTHKLEKEMKYMHIDGEGRQKNAFVRLCSKNLSML